jgi:hypothetical protein
MVDFLSPHCRPQEIFLGPLLAGISLYPSEVDLSSAHHEAGSLSRRIKMKSADKIAQSSCRLTPASMGKEGFLFAQNVTVP